MKGLILTSRARAGESASYSVWTPDDGGVIRDIDSTLSLKPGESISTGDEGEIHSAEIGDGAELAKKHAAWLDEFVDRGIGKKAHSSGIDGLDTVTKTLWKQLSACGALVLKKLGCAAPIIVRFHNDSDGAGGAYGLFASLNEFSGNSGHFANKGNTIWIMHAGISYGRYDAETDLMIAGSYTSIEKPLLIVIDFGTTTESNDGIRRISDAFDVVWLDHHPVVEEFSGKKLAHYVNPWLHGGDSAYTAGFLACMLGKTFSEVDTSAMESASLIGDYSKYAADSEGGEDLSILLDMLTSDVKVAFGPAVTSITPYEIDKVVQDPGRMGELVSYARMRLSEAIGDAMMQVKKHVAAQGSVYVLDFEAVKSEQTKYPLPGRFSSKLLDKITETDQKPAVLIVHSGKYISVRVGAELAERVDLVDVIGEMKDRHPEEIEAGGGHRSASGIKLAAQDEKGRIVRDLVSIIKDRMDRAA